MTTPDVGGAALSPTSGVDPAAPWTTDVQRVQVGALDQWRLNNATDPDTGRFLRHATTAVALCDRYLDRPEPFTVANVPQPVIDAAITATGELYKRKDAPFGITGAWTPDGGSMRISRDVLAGVESMLAPYRGGWGLA